MTDTPTPQGGYIDESSNINLDDLDDIKISQIPGKLELQSTPTDHEHDYYRIGLRLLKCARCGEITMA